MGLVPNVDVAWPSGARGTISIRVGVRAFRLARPDPRLVTTSAGRSR